MELTRNFKKLSKNDVAIAGGKGASLGEMTLAGIPVPTGFVILSDSFERFIKESELVAEIDACLDSVNHEEIHTVENASEKIKALIMDKEIPKDVSKDIVKEFNKLGAKFVAVRSSATSEDSASAAWAGQLESYLNTTKESLLENVKKCWASLFTPRAIFYRFEKNLHKEKVSVAVVVQKMIESEESGIAFSVHPVTQDYNQLIIEAGFGLGEAIVSGQITPDSYVVDKRSYEIIEKNISVQTRGIYRLAKGGNEWRDIPQKKGEKQVLSNKEIIELSKLIIKIEKHYGFPVDVEWARSGGKFYIVQSRPITTLTDVKNTKNLEKKENNYKIDDYILEFEAEGLKPLFQELMYKNYYPDNSAMTYSNNILKSLISKIVWDKMGEEGLKILSTEDFKKFDDASIKIKEANKKVPKLIDKKIFNKNDLIKLLDIFEDIAKNYGYFNIGYLEKAYKEENKTKLLKENLRKIEDLKNKIKEDFNKIFFFSDGHWSNLLKKIGQQFKINEETINWYLKDELLHLFEGKSLSKQDIEERKKSYVFYSYKEKYKFLQGNNAKNFIIYFEDDSNKPDITSFEGIVANISIGKVKGIVKIINVNYENFDETRNKINEMKKGDILVSRTTDPSIIEACKKASAIVTDIGGMLSHAAITSRELNIPSIIGTKIATSVLHDGDLVEVDADKGVVKILKRAREEEKNPDTYFIYLERDFSLGLVEVNSVEGDLNKKPWVKEKTPFFPYCFFIRKNNLIQYIFSKKGVEWVKEQINQRNLENPDYYKYIIKKIKETIAPIINILDNEKTLEINQLSNFVEISKKTWDWFEAHWWNIYLFEDQGKKKELEYLLKERKRYANFAPAINNVIRKTILKAYPKYKRYVDVISVDEAISGKIPELDILEKRLNGFIYINHQLILDKSETEIENEYNLAIEKSEFDPDISEIKGNMAYKGKVRGNVKILKINKDMEKMEKGDILVAPTTMPDLMSAIKKAAAIVADEGGMLSHAAIISRELKIPSIVGTNIATQVLRDGDVVEVDADNGVVRILERENKKVEEESNSKDNTINWVNHISRDMSLTAIWYPYYSYTQGLKLFNANGQNMLYFSIRGFIKGYKDKAGQEITYKGIRKVVSEGRLREVLIKFEELIKQRELLVNEFCTADLTKKTIDWIKNKVNNFHEFYITYWNYHLFCFNLGEALIKTEFEKLLEDNKELISRVRKVNPFLIFDEKFLPHLYDYLSKKENIDKQLLFYLLPQELLNYLNKNYKLNVKELNKRKEYSLLADIYGKELFESGDNALKKYNEIIPKEESIQIINEFKGNSAFKGKTRGLVTIVKLKKDLEKIKDGSILVTYQTTPEFTPYLKKVAGIITDEGGVASHASIISRELKIPCIIATKIATQVLHDGDLVEVDADMGVVKVLEKGKESLSEDPTYIDGKKWDLTITRNMSFWHQYLSDIGHVHNTKDFGIDGSLEIMSLTVDGTHTSAFNNQTNSSEINKKIIDLISKKDGIKIIKEKYKKNAKELFNSLKKCKIKLNIKNWDDFQKKYQKFAAGLYLTVIIGRNGGELLFNKLKDAGYKEQDIPEIISYITYPNESTPLFKSQKDMLKIGKKIQNKKLDKNKIDKELKSWLIEHQHIPINFCEDPWTIEDTRKQLIDFLKKDCEKELIFFEKSHQERIKKKQEILNKIDNKEISILANAIAEGTYLNEFRKNVFSKVSLEYRDIFKTIAKKGNSNNWRDVYYLTPQETLSLLEGKKFAIADKIKERKYVLLYPNSDGEIVIADSAKTKSLVDFVEATYGKSNNTQINQETELKGFSANKGKVSGIVKVILSSKDFHKINRNEILVTTMTSVDFVPIMEKAAAFVTNEGGITSHASIVAREMNKPCIIGTKIATQVLHDGDLVEVDADSGVVRVLERVK